MEYSYIAPLRDPQALMNALGVLERDKLLAGVQINEQEGVLSAAVLDPPPPALTPELEARQSPRLGAFLMLLRNVFRLWHVNKDALDRTFAGLQKHAGTGLAQSAAMRGPAKFHDITSEALVFPRSAQNQEEATQRLTEGIEHYFETEWLHRPLKSLGGVPPIDAAGHPVLRKKLAGAIAFLADCAALPKYPYDFDRLRRKAGLLDAQPATTAAAAGPDIGAMGTAELSALAPSRST